jgi:hypothetical protein
VPPEHRPIPCLEIEAPLAFPPFTSAC